MRAFTFAIAAASIAFAVPAWSFEPPGVVAVIGESDDGQQLGPTEVDFAGPSRSYGWFPLSLGETSIPDFGASGRYVHLGWFDYTAWCGYRYDTAARRYFVASGAVWGENLSGWARTIGLEKTADGLYRLAVAPVLEEPPIDDPVEDPVVVVRAE